MRRTVLIVDDVPALCRAIARELASVYDVVTAHTYDDALAALARLPDVAAIVTDLLLGGGADGLDLLAVAQVSSPAAVRLLITGTSHTLTAKRREIAHAVIAKPWPYGHLLTTIGALGAGPTPPGEPTAP